MRLNSIVTTKKGKKYRVDGFINSNTVTAHCIATGNSLVLNRSSIIEVEQEFRAGDRVRFLAISTRGKKNINKVAKAGLLGTIVSKGVRSSRYEVMVDGTIEPVRLSAFCMEHYSDTDENELLLIRNQFAVEKGSNLIVYISDLAGGGNSCKQGERARVRYLSDGHEDVKPLRIKRYIPTINIIKKIKKLSAPLTIKPYSQEVLEALLRAREIKKAILSTKDKLIKRKLIEGSGSDIRNARMILRDNHPETLSNMVYRTRTTRSSDPTVLYFSSKRRIDKRSIANHYYRFKREVVETENFRNTDFRLKKSKNVFTEKGQILKLATWLRTNRINLVKIPLRNDKNTYVGIELEVCSPIDLERVKRHLKELNMDRFCHVTYDRSIRPPRDFYDVEVTALFKKDSYKKDLGSLLTALSSIGCIVNHSCGTHVHLDMRNREHFKTIHYNLIKFQDMMFNFTDKSWDRSNNKYCHRVQLHNFNLKTLKSMETVRLQLGQAGNPRYAGISTYYPYFKYKTFEIRMLEGTLDQEKLFAWIDFLQAICEIKTPIPNGVDLTNVLPDEINQMVSKYITNESPKEKSSHDIMNEALGRAARLMSRPRPRLRQPESSRRTRIDSLLDMQTVGLPTDGSWGTLSTAESDNEIERVFTTATGV